MIRRARSNALEIRPKVMTVSTSTAVPKSSHETAWSKDGATELANREMLRVPHDPAKGNR